VRILIVLTSHDQLGSTGVPTGLWYEELAAPYYLFTDAGHELTLVSPKGGKPPVDPKSTKPPFDTPAGRRFDADQQAQAVFANTGLLSDVSADDFDTVFYPGGHGPLFDLAEDPSSIALIENFYAAGKFVVTVCHAPGVLRHVKGADGQPLVAGKRATGFTNGEEKAVGLTDVVPFLVEDELIRLGANYEKVGDWEPYVVTDGLLITGQNPASAQGAAETLLRELSASR
jgi:putative intracellular protease/amidase